MRWANMRILVAVAALLAAGIVPVSAQPGQPASRCTHDTFPVSGQNVTVTACAGAPDSGQTVAVAETLKGAGGSFTHTMSIQVLPGASASRGVDDVALAPLGLQYTLHLTLAYHDATVVIEHALLLPGAIPLK
jgi:hypothetical protein